MSGGGWLNALLGRIFNSGTSLPLAGGLNFTGGLQAVTNEEENRIDVTFTGEGSGSVLSVFDRDGVVTAQAGDYSAALVSFSPAGGITATDVQAAIEEAAALGGGEANTLANRGAGESLVGTKVGEELGIKSLSAGVNVSLTPSAGDVAISVIGESIPQPGVYGEMFVSTPAATSFGAPATPVKAAGTTSIGEAQDWDDDGGTANRLRYVGGFATFIKLTASISLSKTSPGTNSYTLYLYRNGVAITPAEKSSISRALAAGDVAALSIQCLTPANPGDYFELWVSCDDGTDDVTVSKFSLIATVSGASVSGFDFIVSTKDELIEVASSYTGGVITLQADKSYFGAADIDLTEGGTSNDRIALQSGTTISSADANTCNITGDSTSAVITGPATGRRALKDLTVTQQGTGPAYEDTGGAGTIGLHRNVNLSVTTGPGVLVSGVAGVFVREGGISQSAGGNHIQVTSAAASVVARNGGYSGGVNGISVSGSGSVGELEWLAMNLTGTAPSGSCILLSGAVSELRVRGATVAGGTYGIRAIGAVTRSVIVGSTFIAPDQASAISGIAPSVEPADGSTSGTFQQIGTNLWRNATGTLCGRLGETPVVEVPLQRVNPQTGTSYTAVQADHGKVIEIDNAAAIAVSLPDLAVGTVFGVSPIGAGQITFAASGAGNTLASENNWAKTRAQYVVIWCHRRSATEWHICGGLTA